MNRTQTQPKGQKGKQFIYRIENDKAVFELDQAINTIQPQQPIKVDINPYIVKG